MSAATGDGGTGCEVCGSPRLGGGGRFCDTHRREHAQRIGEQIAAVRARHARRLAVHEAVWRQGMTDWAGFFHAERLFARQEAARPGGQDSPDGVRDDEK